jgi:hypothetical protein
MKRSKLAEMKHYVCQRRRRCQKLEIFKGAYRDSGLANASMPGGCRVRPAPRGVAELSPAGARSGVRVALAISSIPVSAPRMLRMGSRRCRLRDGL